MSNSQAAPVSLGRQADRMLAGRFPTVLLLHVTIGLGFAHGPETCPVGLYV